MTERDFVEKVQRAGFDAVEIVERVPVGVQECALYPLITEELLELMRTLIPPERQERLAVAIVLRARLGAA